MDERKITRNAARCLNCGDTVESKFRHDLRMCTCGDLFIDGGLDYLRRGGHPDRYTELVEYEEPGI